MPLTRSQLLKILADNRQKLTIAESEPPAISSDDEEQAEAQWHLAILRKNIAGIEKILAEQDASSPP
jgi:hypothetical protein